jgi:hypothetical protein
MTITLYSFFFRAAFCHNICMEMHRLNIKNETRKAAQIGIGGILTASTFFLPLASFLAIAPKLFLPEGEEVQSDTKMLMLMTGICLLLDFCRYASLQQLRINLKDANVPPLISISALLAGLPCSWLLNQTSLKLCGVQLGASMGLFISASLLFSRWLRPINQLTREENLLVSTNRHHFFRHQTPISIESDERGSEYTALLNLHS